GPWTDDDFKPATKKQIIVRMLRNLTSLAMNDESNDGTLRYLDLILALSPEEPRERYTRAMFRLQTGDAEGGKQDLRWLLDHEPRGIDLERVEEMLRSL